MKERKEATLYIAIIWLGVFLSLSIVGFIAVKMNQTAMKENERSFNRNLKTLAESTSKSIKLFMEGLVSEIILLTEVDAVKKYKTKEVDMAFRGIISNHGELISHMILLDETADVKLMVTKEQEIPGLGPKLKEFYSETMTRWRVNMSDTILNSESFRGLAIGMPIFRRMKKSLLKEDGPSWIYESGMVVALTKADDLAEGLINQVLPAKSGTAWALTDGGLLLGDARRLQPLESSLYPEGKTPTKSFIESFANVVAGEKEEGWSYLDSNRRNIKIDLGGDVWFVAVAQSKILGRQWTVAVAAPESEATGILNKSFQQSGQLFLVVVAILIAGGSLMTRANRRWARAEERAIHAETLAEKNRKLNELNRRMDEFVAVVSHDIRSPLSVIMGLAKMIRSDEGGEKFKRETSTILRSCNRLMQLVNDILDVSKLESGKVMLAYDPVVIDDLINESVMTMIHSADEKDQKIDLSLGEPTLMEGDTSKLLQVLNNLIANAIKFTPKQGKIRIGKRVEEKQLVIMVSDTGPGIPKEERDSVFDKFEQIRGRLGGIEPGSGLGLTICMNLVQLHGGVISVGKGLDGRGSTFYVKLPLKRRSLQTALPIVDNKFTENEKEETFRN